MQFLGFAQHVRSIGSDHAMADSQVAKKPATQLGKLIQEKLAQAKVLKCHNLSFGFVTWESPPKVAASGCFTTTQLLDLSATCQQPPHCGKLSNITGPREGIQLTCEALPHIAKFKLLSMARRRPRLRKVFGVGRASETFALENRSLSRSVRGLRQ